MSGVRALVVADSPEAVDHYVPLLKQVGYDVAVAEDFTSPPPTDIVIADVTSFRFSPFASLQAQRRMGCLSPAILVSARVTDQMAVELFELGIRDFILKPVENDVLISRINDFATRMQA